MAEKISIQIALEGGQAVERQLADIGEAGQQAFNQIEQAASQVGGFKNLKPEQVTAKLKEMGVEGTAAFDKIQRAVSTAVRFETIVQGVQSVERAFVALGRAAGPVGVAIAIAFQAAAKATIAFAGEINKASDQAVKLGLSLEQLKKQQKIFEQLGVSSKAAVDGISHFQKEMQKLIDQAPPGSQLAFFGNAVRMTSEQLQPFLDRLRQMPDGFERTALAISQLGEQAGTQFIQGLRRTEGSMTSAETKAYDLGQAIQRLSQAWADFGSVGLAPTLTAGINAITTAIDTLSAKLAENPWGAWLQVASMLNPIHAAVQAIISLVGDLAAQIARIAWDAISSVGVAAWDALTSAIQRAIDAVLRFIGLRPSAPSGGGGEAPAMAAGGMIGGRGTGTSDSNLAWVSRGEHIMPARAVSQPGVLSFLEALRRSGGNLRGVLDGMGRFALGGLVPRAMPAFAGGGPVGGMSHVTIQFPGLPAINGLRAPSDVVGELQRAAAMAQIRSGGRKPSRYS